MGIIITVTTDKGGQGKTPIVLNLAGYLACNNLTALIIDLDSQSNSSNLWDFSKRKDIFQPKSSIFKTTILDLLNMDTEDTSQNIIDLINSSIIKYVFIRGKGKIDLIP